ncbi:MAG: tetratricopeptide repeat protein [Candidatus Saccharicenans sp.]|nr:tetratricopeptide repeat protein [Candidatus Saccharicenans sp.]MDH7492641.1 tetratricopeptide repeat protein [Candidatus Saccharicenans sp.]
MKKMVWAKIRWLGLVLLLGSSLACVSFSPAYKQGNQAEMNKDYDEAIKYYEQALIQNPKETVYRLALFRAKAAAAISSVEKARQLLSEGQKDEALNAYKKALSYDPSNRLILEEYRKVAGLKPPVEEKRREIVIEQPVKLKAPAEKLKLRFTDASLKAIFQAVGRFTGINFLFDEQFRDLPVSIDLTDMTLEQGLNSLCLSGRAFYRIIDEKTVIIVPDNPQKRNQYEINAIKTIYLSNLNAQDVQNSLVSILRTQYKAPTIIVDKNRNSITIRDNPRIVALAEKMLRSWDKPKGEVVIDLEIMEVSRQKLQTLGTQFGQSYAGLRYTGAELPESGWLPLEGIDFSLAGNYQITLPSVLLQFLETDTDTKIIAQPRLRGVDSEQINYMVGQKVPIPQTTFSPIAAGGVSQQPIVSYTYQDVGIEVNIKPRLHQEKEVSLELEIKITSIGGKGIADIPIISTREVKNVIRLRDGETNLLAGLLRDEERKSLKGIAGLKNLPILGNLFSSTDRTVEQTDVILTITPHIIRTMPLTDEDGKPLWIDNEAMAFSTAQAGVPEEVMVSEEEITPEAMAEAGPGMSTISFMPGRAEVPVKNTFNVTLELNSPADITSLSMNLSFDPKLLRLREIQRGDLVAQLGGRGSFLQNISPGGGVAVVGFSSPSPATGVRSGSLATLVFETLAAGETRVVIASVQALGVQGRPVSLAGGELEVIIR